MTAGVDFLELADGDLGVDGGGLELGVSQELLDVPDVGPALEHVRGAGVTKELATAPKARGRHPFADHAADDIGIEGFSVAGEEKGLHSGIEAKTGTDLL